LLKTKAVIEVMAFVFKEYGYVTSLRNSIFTSLRRNPFISIAYGNKPGHALLYMFRVVYFLQALFMIYYLRLNEGSIFKR